MDFYYFQRGHIEKKTPHGLFKTLKKKILVFAGDDSFDAKVHLSQSFEVVSVIIIAQTNDTALPSST